MALRPAMSQRMVMLPRLALSLGLVPLLTWGPLPANGAETPPGNGTDAKDRNGTNAGNGRKKGKPRLAITGGGAGINIV